jgi:ribonuclease HI
MRDMTPNDYISGKQSGLSPRMSDHSTGSYGNKGYYGNPDEELRFQQYADIGSQKSLYFGLHNRHSSYSVPHYSRPATITLFFGSVVKPDSLVGGCAWWMNDEQQNVIANGSLPVIQTFPSLIRLEYEALLNGLKAAFQKNLRNIVIKGSSQFVINHLLTGVFNPFFTSMYSTIKDLYVAIQRLLPEFNYEVELISPRRNYFSHKLAENIIIDYHRKRDMRIAKQQIRDSTLDKKYSMLINKTIGNTNRSPLTDNHTSFWNNSQYGSNEAGNSSDGDNSPMMWNEF